MNSLQKNEGPIRVETPEAYVAMFEKSLLMLNQAHEVEIVMKKLKYLGLNYDPFGNEVTSECRQVMDSLGLTSHLKNPYQATNILLRLLDKTEERLNAIKQ